MRRRALHLATWALGLMGALGIATPSARAEFFEFTSAVSITGVTTPTSGTTITSGSASFGLGSFTQTANYAGVKMNADSNEVRFFALGSNTSDGFHENASLSTGTDVIVGGIEALTNPSTPKDNISFTYSLTLNVTDYVSASATTALGTGSITITGRITGSLGAGGVNLGNFDFATNPASGTFITTNNEQYTVSLSGFTPPGTSTPGFFGIHVSAVPGPINVKPVPEPSSLALLGLGGLGIATMYRRRARRMA